jgi:hypothetical protein
VRTTRSGRIRTRGQPLLLQRRAQRDGDEVLEQLVHVEEEAVHGERIGAWEQVLRRGAPQDGLAEPQGGLITGVETGGLPAGQLLPADQRQRVGETDPLVRQPPPHGPRNAGQPQQPLDGAPQDAVLGGVSGVGVVRDLHGGRAAEVPPDLIRLAYPPAHHERRLLHLPVALEDPLAQRRVDPSLHGVGERGHHVVVRAGVDGALPVVAPGPFRVEAESEQEEDPAHRGLGQDAYDRTAGRAERADVAPRPQQPVAVLGRVRCDALEYAGGGEGPAGRGAERHGDGGPVLVQHHIRHGCGHAGRSRSESRP